MSASANDLVRNAAPNFQTTLSSSMLISDTSATLASVTGLPTGTGVTITVDAVDSNGNPTPTLKETMTGVVSGSTVTNLLRGLDGTTQQAHASGAVVVQWFTANDWNDFQAAFTNQHSQLDGSHTAITATSISTTGNGSIGGTLTATGTITANGGLASTTGSFSSNVTMSKLVQLGNATVASGATITPDAANTNFYTVTALAVAATIAAPTGTPVDGQSLIIRIKDNGVQQTLTWNAIYRAIGVTIPTTTDTGKTIYVGCKYNTEDAVWDVLSVGRQ